MCAPVIIEGVRAELSRRGFLAGVAGAVAAAATSAQAQTAVRSQGGPARLSGGFRSVVDLTHTFSPKLPVFPAFKPVQIKPKFSIAKDGFFANEITFDEHTGTHMDAPVHFIANSTPADRLPVDRLIAPLAVVSIAARAAKDPDTALTVDDIMAWEKQHGRVPRGAVVAVHTGWDARIGTPDRFLNKDKSGTMHAPGFSEAAARFLAEEREIVGAGIDTLSLDIGAAAKFVAHLALLGAGKYGIELMANLTMVPPSGATIIVGAPKHEGASGGPVRLLALV
jgi:kynurenine formamidase